MASKSQIHPGKKKKNVRQKLVSPFPIQITSITGKQAFYYETFLTF